MHWWLRLRPGGAIGWASGCHAKGCEFNSGWIITQGLKITEEKVRPLQWHPDTVKPSQIMTKNHLTNTFHVYKFNVAHKRTHTPFKKSRAWSCRCCGSPCHCLAKCGLPGMMFPKRLVVYGGMLTKKKNSHKSRGCCQVLGYVNETVHPSQRQSSV